VVSRMQGFRVQPNRRISFAFSEAAITNAGDSGETAVRQSSPGHSTFHPGVPVSGTQVR
jgi:hypothetical protein